MISIRKYLDGTLAAVDAEAPRAHPDHKTGDLFSLCLEAYRAALLGMGRASVDACPALGTVLHNALATIAESLHASPLPETVAAADASVRSEVEMWGRSTARHYQQKAGEVKEILLVMARTAESVGERDQRYTQQLSEVTANLKSIASLDDISQIRVSIEKSAADLKGSIDRMTAEGKAVLGRLRLQVASFETRLAEAEQIASCDGLTRLRSRLWMETQIEIRIIAAKPFCVAQLDLDGFKRVNDVYGLVIDSWLPDLDLAEFMRDFRLSFPSVDVIDAAGATACDGPRSPHRQEIFYALRTSLNVDTAAWKAAPDLGDELPGNGARKPAVSVRSQVDEAIARLPELTREALLVEIPRRPVLVSQAPPAKRERPVADRLPELVGDAESMLDVSRRIRLVAPRSTAVLIEGPTGSGKELVAEALHRLSPRSRKPFIAINCAAIPEALLEAELFGHTRGAFTGAVQGRIGRIESADGGTLFLDEIGEMPLALQSKLLRFVECGELQRVGDNETLKVNVRIVAATHQQLARQTQEGKFRSDLYYRLAVFLINTPALIDHMEDLPLLVGHFMEKMGRTEPVKRVDTTAMAKLKQHNWPGNVRELEHVLERAAILAGDDTTITAREIDFGLAVN